MIPHLTEMSNSNAVSFFPLCRAFVLFSQTNVRLLLKKLNKDTSTLASQSSPKYSPTSWPKSRLPTFVWACAVPGWTLAHCIEASEKTKQMPNEAGKSVSNSSQWREKRQSSITSNPEKTPKRQSNSVKITSQTCHNKRPCAPHRKQDTVIRLKKFSYMADIVSSATWWIFLIYNRFPTCENSENHVEICFDTYNACDMTMGVESCSCSDSRRERSSEERQAQTGVVMVCALTAFLLSATSSHTRSTNHTLCDGAACRTKPHISCCEIKQAKVSPSWSERRRYRQKYTRK